MVFLIMDGTTGDVGYNRYNVSPNLSLQVYRAQRNMEWAQALECKFFFSASIANNVPIKMSQVD